LTTTRALKLLHAVNTAAFALAAGYVAVLALRQAGVKWWLIFSLSGHSAIAAFVLTSAYLFAIFRGGSRNQACSIEHPLTSSRQYMILYSIIPLLGAVGGGLSSIGMESKELIINTVVIGTIGATFCFWIIIDPLLTVIESFGQASRTHRAKRVKAMRDLRTQQQRKRIELLEQLDQQEKQKQHIWQEEFSKDAIILAQLAQEIREDRGATRTKAVEIGLAAFRRGGVECMEALQHLAIEFAKHQGINGTTGKFISNWWDGIGGWRDVCGLFAEN